MTGHRRTVERRQSWLKGAGSEYEELDSTPVQRGPVEDERKRPIPVKRSKKIGKGLRVDPTRVSGPIRVVLEPMLWLAFISGVVWALVALDPNVISPGEGVVFYEHTLPLAIIVSAILLISTISALMWLTVSTTATRARTSFAGLGMIASGWLFAKVDPINPQDSLGLAWFSIGVGVLLVAICAVPWPTRPSPPTRPTSIPVKVLLAVLAVAGVVIAFFAWEAAQVGLIGLDPGDTGGWDALLPLLGFEILLMASARFLLHRPAVTE